MVLFPDVQKTAQAEIDRVIGQDRLPEHEDQNALPYITAIMREMFRCVLDAEMSRTAQRCLKFQMASPCAA